MPGAEHRSVTPLIRFIRDLGRGVSNSIINYIIFVIFYLDIMTVYFTYILSRYFAKCFYCVCLTQKHQSFEILNYIITKLVTNSLTASFS